MVTHLLSVKKTRPKRKRPQKHRKVLDFSRETWKKGRKGKGAPHQILKSQNLEGGQGKQEDQYEPWHRKRKNGFG